MAAHLWALTGVFGGCDLVLPYQASEHDADDIDARSVDASGREGGRRDVGGDIFVASYTGTGTPRWARSLGSTESDWGIAVATNGSTVAATGWVGAKANLGGGIRTGYGYSDIFVVTLGP